MSKLTCVILPATAGATSVCASLTKLPVASKYVGIGRITACAAVTSTVCAAVFVFEFADVEPVLQPDKIRRPASPIAKTLQIVFSVVILKVYVCAAAKFLNSRVLLLFRDPAK